MQIWDCDELTHVIALECGFHELLQNDLSLFIVKWLWNFQIIGISWKNRDFV